MGFERENCFVAMTIPIITVMRSQTESILSWSYLNQNSRLVSLHHLKLQVKKHEIVSVFFILNISLALSSHTQIHQGLKYRTVGL